MDKKNCPFCSEEILETAIKCKHCGEFLEGNQKPSSGVSDYVKFASQKKSAVLSAILNLIIPGTGYIYCGRVGLGLVAMVFVIFLAVVTMGYSLIITTPIMIIDGILCAGRANRKLAKSLA